MIRAKLISAYLLLLVVAPFAVQAQSTTTDSDSAKGKAIIRIFTNFHSGFGSANDDRGFELNRSYLGYEYSFGKGLSIKAVVDAGKSSKVDDIQRIVFMKNAQLTWKTGRWNLNFGLISTTQFKVQEDFWGYRYMLMSFQDQYKYGSSADLGASASYRFADWISADVILVNGEGYKKLQINDGIQVGLGTTIKPTERLTLRLYGSINEAANKSEKDIYNYAMMLGYKSDRYMIAAEYNMLKNAKNVADNDQSGISLYTSGKLSDKVNLFARYDQMFSRRDWNIAKDESAIIAGAEFRPHKNIKIAPNFRMIMPEATDAKNRCYAYISCYFGF